MTRRSPYSWLVNNLTYSQIYAFICVIFFLSLLPIGYFWVKTHLDRIHLINAQLKAIDDEILLKSLFIQIQQHRMLAQRFLSGQQNIQSEMETLQDQIRYTLQQTLATTSPQASTSIPYEPTFLGNKGDHRDIENRWNFLIQNLPSLSLNKSNSLHTQLIHDLLVQFGYLGVKVGVESKEQIEDYAMVESIFLRLPFLQENLSQLTLLSEKALSSQNKVHDDLKIILERINFDLTYLNESIELHISRFHDFSHHQLIQTLNSYRMAVEEFTDLINKDLLTKRNPQLTLFQVFYQSENALKLGYELWDEGLSDLKQIFQTEKESVTRRLWFVLLLTLFLMAFASFLGLSITRKVTTRLTHLTHAMNGFTNGNLSIRVPVTYQDEIGHQAQAFNHMAQRLEEIINHLNELLEATTALANGNLMARIKVRNNGTEFDRVAQSFNQMAENYEMIIRRLQQIGLTLTTSANEIADASKEQETIVVQQESTTREIAVTANEISSTAKGFASTMNDVGQAAEQTSDLALTGKESLTHMESIMRQMVDASGNIATKLAVLNEKAGNITSVVTTITKVADQTNLLSLNASIEAEKAGEYGRSFAVIAREIRRLADQTAIATLDIEKIVHEIMTAISSSVLAVDDFTQEIRKGVKQARTVSEQLAKIIEQVQTFAARFDLVNQGMQAQSAGAEQINKAISQLSQTAQQTSESIHQFHKTIQELNNAVPPLGSAA